MLPSISSPLSSYLEKINTLNLPAEILKRSREELPEIKDQIRILKDIEQASIFRLREMTNEKLLSLLKVYTFFDQGSPRLFSNLTQELYKRINSFNFEDLSTIVYNFSTSKESTSIFEVVKELIMKDPMAIPSNSIGKLSFAFAVKNKYDSDFYKVLSNIFVVANDSISPDTGVLFLTGIYKVNHVNPLLLLNAQTFIEKHWKQFKGGELAHVVFILHKFGLENFANKKIKEIEVDKLSAADVDKIIGCYISKSLDPPENILMRLDQHFSNMTVTALELFELIYSLNFLKNSEKLFKQVFEIIEKVVKIMTNKEKLMIFLAILSNNRETEEFLQMYSQEFSNSFETDDILMLFPCFVKRGSLFTPYTSNLLETMTSRIRGRELKMQEALIVMYSLLKLQYSDPYFWKTSLDFVKSVKITSAEEYIQVKKTVQQAKTLGIDIDDCLSSLIQKYESS
jgi:hypothetical protein